MLNGRKRWIGNATFADIIVIWARSSETKQASLSHLHKLAPSYPCTLPCLVKNLVICWHSPLCCPPGSGQACMAMSPWPL